MAVLKDILYKVPITSTSGNMGVEVLDLHFDSRQIKPGYMFVAIRGAQSDGHLYIDKAIAAGAVAVVCETKPEVCIDQVTYIEVKDASFALGIIASNYFGNPSAKLQLIAVTGTNGKTTIATLLYQTFRNLGYNCGLLSTIQNQINDKVIPTNLTTPDSISINKLLAEMVKIGCTHCFMEASSHAIVQHRTVGLQFTGAIFTNISHDHLDYHGTFDEYIKAKKLLFDTLPASAFALVNIDDKRGNVMLQNTKAKKYTYSLQFLADFKGKVMANTIHGLELIINNKEVWFKLIGEFNAYNILAILGTAALLGEEEDEVLRVLSELNPVNGRFEQIISEDKIIGIIDYAHTPNALENVLSTINQFKESNQVITVVGCGGNRDADKRPMMAKIACKYSDKVILTSDNPRDEQPEEIIKEMQSGVRVVDKKKVLSITDRNEAIKTAVALANPKDIILLAGKGHETYQEIKGVKHPFDDKKKLQEIFKMMGK